MHVGSSDGPKRGHVGNIAGLGEGWSVLRVLHAQPNAGLGKG